MDKETGGGRGGAASGEMTQSLEDYLEAVFVLIEENGSAQVRDVARLLSVKMPSVVKAIHHCGLKQAPPSAPQAALARPPCR